MAVTIFEVAWQMRGMEELFEDFRFRPELASYLLDRITDVRRDMARFFAGQDVDVLILGDDVSMQTGMLMSPAAWRKWFKGRLSSIIGEARSVKPDLPVFYHSDGNPAAITRGFFSLEGWGATYTFAVSGTFSTTTAAAGSLAAKKAVKGGKGGKGKANRKPAKVR